MASPLGAKLYCIHYAHPPGCVSLILSDTVIKDVLSILFLVFLTNQALLSMLFSASLSLEELISAGYISLSLPRSVALLAILSQPPEDSASQALPTPSFPAH
jgi:hypothetical protein